MEALLFLLNSAAVVVMVYMGLRDDRRPPGAPQTSVFRTFDDGAVQPGAVAEQARQARIARSHAP